jgi:GMP synthase-like glutamine amidotransferase/SAM-dependent methyltransferase
MRLHYLQHVPFEDPANVGVWAAERGHTVTSTRLFSGEALPAVDSVDLLVVLGGPMNVDEHDAHPWLVEEKRFIGQAIHRRKAVLGICLGAQLAAEVLGARVTRSRHREIGWFPVSLMDAAKTSPLFRNLPRKFTAFHWHGDTFDIPAGAVRLAESEACRNQTFQYDAHVLGMQFHLEYSGRTIARMIREGGDELVDGAHVQSAAQIAGRHGLVRQTRQLLFRVLDAIRGCLEPPHGPPKAKDTGDVCASSPRTTEMRRPMFDDLTDVYEAMIDWPKRLANEEPFYRGLFERVDVESLVDVACGTGRHAAAFRSWGLRVEGADVSPNMIERARAAFNEPPDLRWVVRGFDQPILPKDPFDAAICVGNSLALAPDVATVRRAVYEMFAAIRQRGVVVVHLLNLWRLPDGPSVWQKCKRATLPQGDVLIFKGVHRSGSRGYVDLIVAAWNDQPQTYTECVPFLGLEASQLERIARQTGASNVQLFGDYQGRPYDRHQSVDLIVVAEK